MPTPLPFWHAAWLRVEPDAQSWVAEVFGYLRIFSLLLLAFLIFRFLKIVGLETYFIDTMEKLEVIVRNATITYSGGPLRLENVSFVNCSFILTDAPAARRLGQTILQSAPVNFTNSGG
jgi:hypothetical protein